MQVRCRYTRRCPFTNIAHYAHLLLPRIRDSSCKLLFSGRVDWSSLPLGEAATTAEGLRTAEVDEGTRWRAVGGRRAAHHDIAKGQIPVSQASIMYYCQPLPKRILGPRRQRLLQLSATFRFMVKIQMSLEQQTALLHSNLDNHYTL